MITETLDTTGRKVMTSREFSEALDQGHGVFQNIVIQGNLELRGRGTTKMEGEIKIIDSLIDSCLIISNLSMSKLDLSGTEITQELIARFTKFNGPMTLIGTSVKEVDLTGAWIRNSVYCGDNLFLMWLFLLAKCRVHVYYDALQRFCEDFDAPELPETVEEGPED